MNIETTNLPTFDNVLLRYSGRRLQFAIKQGILPSLERLRQVLSKKSKFKKSFLSKQVSLTPKNTEHKQTL